MTAATPGAWDELARRAAEPSASAEVEALRQLLCFRVDASPYALPVESVREIVRMRPITAIPRVAADVRGVISLRGEILQVIDLRLRLGLPPTKITGTTRIVVVQSHDERAAGILVDAVEEVLRVCETDIGPAVTGDVQGLVAGLCSRGERFVSLLDLERVLGFSDA